MIEPIPRFCAICDKPLTGEPQRVLCEGCAKGIRDHDTQQQGETA